MLEDPVTFQQIVHEVDEDIPSIPRGRELLSRREKHKSSRSLKKGRKTRKTRHAPEYRYAEGNGDWTGILDGESRKKSDVRDYFMAGALGVRSGKECDAMSACVGDGDVGGSSALVCRDRVDDFDPGGGVVGGWSAAESGLDGFGSGILRSELKEKKRGKAQVRFDVEDNEVERCSGRGWESDPSQVGHECLSESFETEKARIGKRSDLWKAFDSRRSSQQYSHVSFQGEDSGISRRTMGESL